jgi:hypothetical protein
MHAIPSAPFVLHTLPISHPFRSDHSNYAWRRVQVKENAVCSIWVWIGTYFCVAVYLDLWLKLDAFPSLLMDHGASRVSYFLHVTVIRCQGHPLWTRPGYIPGGGGRKFAFRPTCMSFKTILQSAIRYSR